MRGKLELICDKPAIVGESPLWDPQRKLLHYIDIRGCLIRSLDWLSGKYSDIKLPQQPGCIAFSSDGSMIAALEDGIYRVEDDAKILPLHSAKKIEGRRFNDGKAGPDGRFYVGTTNENSHGAFYSLDQKGNLSRLFGNVGVSNGLAWSADGKTMYYCDSPKGKLEAFSFNAETGQLSDRRTIRVWPGKLGVFDGLTIDSEGKLWIAVWTGWCVLRVDPENGEILDRIEVPASKVSCCAFAGENLDYLVITTAAYNADSLGQPLAGSLFRIKVDVSGAPVYTYSLHMF